MNPILLLGIGLAVVLGGILWLRLHPFLALLGAALLVAGMTPGAQIAEALANKAIHETTKQTGKVPTEQGQALIRERFSEETSRTTPIIRITRELGVMFGNIGLVIAFACVIGRSLLASGAADRIVRSALKLTGKKGAPVAFLGSGFALGIPVFFDSLFLLAIPLAKALWLKLRNNYLLLIVAIIAGGSMTHSLVPPTPGPLYVASALNVNLGTMILAGLAVGVFTAGAGFLYGTWLNRRMDIPFRESPDSIQKLEATAARDISELPSLTVSVLPIVLPVLLIAGGTLAAQFALPADWKSIFKLLGDKNIALAIGAALALITLARHVQDKKEFAAQMQGALQEAGVILLICCAGGAFGAILLQTGIGPHLQNQVGTGASSLWLLPLAFAITTVIRAAQGSATVAMITAVGIVGSFAVGHLDYHPVYLALAIGCGSKPLPWMNDSGFWVISKMSGMTEKETLLTFTATLSIMGVVGIVVTMIGAALFPMI